LAKTEKDLDFFCEFCNIKFSWKKFGGSEVLNRVLTDDKSDFESALQEFIRV